MLQFYIRALIHVICTLSNVLSFAMLMTRTLLYTLYVYKEREKEAAFIFKKMFIFTFLIHFYPHKYVIILIFTYFHIICLF